MSSAEVEFARALADMERRIAALERPPTLAYSSLDRGTLPVNDESGTVRTVIGQQSDGTYTITDLNAPPPPAPAAPSLSTQPGVLIVSSYGTTTDGSPWPLDFAGLAVHVGMLAGFVPTAATKVAEFTTNGGSITLALDPGTYYVKLVAVNTSGAESAPSTEVSADVSAAATGAGGVKTYSTATAPTGLTAADAGALWFDTSNGNAPSRWDGTQWVSVQDGSIATAQTAANNAQTTANQAQQDAQAAHDLAAGKVTTFYAASTAPPTAQGVGDLWVVSDQSNTLKRWDGSVWSSVRDAGISQALTDAQTAQSSADNAQATADGKIVTFTAASTAPPTAEGTGDLWIVSDQSNKLKRWDGTAWVDVRDSGISQALTDASNAQAAANNAQSSADTANTAASNAQTAANNAQTTADGKNTVFWNASTAPPTGNKTGDLWFQPDVDYACLQWDGTAWQTAPFGTSAIADQAVTAAKLEAVLALVSRLVAGDPAGARAELGTQGLAAYDASGVQTFIADTAGNVTVTGAVQSTDYVESSGGWRLDSEQAQFQNANVVDTLGADTMTTRSLTLGGDDLGVDILPNMSQGVLLYGTISNGTTSVQINAGSEWIVAMSNLGSVTAERVYVITYAITLNRNGLSANGTAEATLYVTEDGTAPTVNSTTIEGSTVRLPTADPTDGPTLTKTMVYRPTADHDTVRFGIGVKYSGPSGSYCQVMMSARTTAAMFLVMDGGPKAAVSGSFSQVHKSSGADDPTPTATYTKQWKASWGQSYDGDDSQYAGGDQGNLFQGEYDSTHGNSKSLFGFDYANIQSVLSGATIDKVELVFRVKHSYYNAGVDVRIKEHGHTSSPATYSAGSVQATRDNCASGSTYTVTLPNSVGNDFKTGVARGLGFGPGLDTTAAYYGYMYGAGSGSAPALKITYTK